MGLQNQARIAFAAALLTIAVGAGGQCADSLTETSVPGFVPNRPAGPVAWNGSVLSVARTNVQVPLVLTRFDQNLNPLGETTVTSSPVGRDLMLLAGGGEFAAVFYASDGRLLFQEINASGNPVGPEIQVGAAHGVFQGQRQQFDAAYNPQLARWEIAYGIPFNADSGLWVTSIPLQSGGGGAILDRRLEVFISDPVPKIAVASNGLIGVSFFRNLNEVPTLLVSAYDGQYNQLKSTVISSNVQLPRLAGSTSSIALLYQAVVGSRTELRWDRFDATGITGSDARIVTGTGIDVVPVGLVWNSTLNEWAIAYLNAPNGAEVFGSDYRIRRLTPGGSLIGDALFTYDPTKIYIPGRYSPIWNGAAYYGSIERTASDNSGSLSYVVKHCPLVGSISVHAPAPVPFQQFTFQAVANGGLAPFTCSWDFGDLSSGQGLTINHSYQKSGTYTVTLTMTDSLGDSSVKSVSVVVIDNIRRRTVKR